MLNIHNIVTDYIYIYIHSEVTNFEHIQNINPFQTNVPFYIFWKHPKTGGFSGGIEKDQGNEMDIAVFCSVRFEYVFACWDQRRVESFIFFYLGFLSRTFTIHRTAEEEQGYLFKSSVPLSLLTRAHLCTLLAAGLKPGTFAFRTQVANH